MHDGSFTTATTDARRASGDRRPNAVDAVVGLRLREIREARRLTREALAGGLGISWQQLAKYERGESRIVASHLFRLAQLLGCPIADFFEGVGPELVAAVYGELPR